jgi:hypothetical protein
MTSVPSKPARPPAASPLSRRDVLGACLALGAVDAWGQAAAASAADLEVTRAAANGATWGPPRRRGSGWFEWRLQAALGGTPARYMDPSQFDLWCEFEGPAGAQRRVTAFWCSDDQGSHWTIRFLPPIAGRWRMRPMARLSEGEARPLGQSGEFVVDRAVPKQRIRVDPLAPTHFAFDDGASFVPVGLNVCWAVSDRPLDDYRRWFTRLARNGGNFARLWMASWSFGIEWKDTGLGQYAQRMERASLLDAVLELAESLGIRVMLCLLNHGAFSLKADSEWKDNPYNEANGGPLASPEQFVTDERALRLFERRIRYVAARWAHSPALHSWEWWNEATWTPIPGPALRPWFERVDRTLRRHDPYQRLRTTSWADRGDAAAWRLPVLDFAQQHDYTHDDPLDHYARQLRDWRGEGVTDKPVLAGELGLDTTFDAKAARPYDWDAVHLHNGLWAPIFLGHAGTALYWWWDQIVDPLDLWPAFRGIARYLQAAEEAGIRVGLHVPRTLTASDPNLRAQILAGPRSALVWMRDADYHAEALQRAWRAETGGGEPQRAWQPAWRTFAAARLRLETLDPSAGPFTVRWFDPRSGDLVTRQAVDSRQGLVELVCPTFSRDIAAIVTSDP